MEIHNRGVQLWMPASNCISGHAPALDPHGFRQGRYSSTCLRAHGGLTAEQKENTRSDPYRDCIQELNSVGATGGDTCSLGIPCCQLAIIIIDSRQAALSRGDPTTHLHARERKKREKEREKAESGRNFFKGGGGGRPGQREETDRESNMQMLLPPGQVPEVRCPAGREREEKEKTPRPAPRREGGGEGEGGRERTKKRRNP